MSFELINITYMRINKIKGRRKVFLGIQKRIRLIILLVKFILCLHTIVALKFPLSKLPPSFVVLKINRFKYAFESNNSI